MRTPFAPLHLLFFAEAFAHDLVHGRLDKPRGYGLAINLAGAVEVVRYWVGDVIRRAGGHDSQYVGVQLQFGW